MDNPNVIVGAIVVVIITICQAVKIAGLPSRWIPLLAIALGIVGAYFFGNGSSLLIVSSGVIVGLTSAGMFDLVKQTVLGK